ncbi:hypothetical protein HX109_06185 [Galbibacter sp. BG1]|uniref:hypothetical protein n=1 Tax=Galbibacter sp. BG1 TaxID=1170699 RepID=UPI0015BF394D|nr:hypothetical protein [Galbibacter sp. BG1]QLE01171.1 hypothetical protein HX109_06185 [Galbibacter sp. BG1]
MIRLLNILFGTVVILGFSQCGASQNISENAPFELGEVKSEPWTAGDNKQANGENVYVPVTAENGATLDSLYYKDQAVKLERIKKDDYLVYIGRLPFFKESQDIIMHADPKKEFGNKPPQLKPKNPFELKENEAVVSYSIDGKINYYKIKGISPSSPIHYRDIPTLKN